MTNDVEHTHWTLSTDLDCRPSQSAITARTWVRGHMGPLLLCCRATWVMPGQHQQARHGTSHSGARSTFEEHPESALHSHHPPTAFWCVFRHCTFTAMQSPRMCALTYKKRPHCNRGSACTNRQSVSTTAQHTAQSCTTCTRRSPTAVAMGKQRSTGGLTPLCST